jgi:hypothetical protein
MAYDHAIAHGDDHEMAGFAEICCQPIRPDRFIEHILGITRASSPWLSLTISTSIM